METTTYKNLLDPELIEEELIKTKKKLDLFTNLFAEPEFYNMDHYKKNLLRFQYESLNSFYMYLTSQYFIEQNMDVFEMYSSGYITKYGQTKTNVQEEDTELEEKMDKLNKVLATETHKHYGNYRNG